MRHFLGLCRHQARCLVVLGLLGLGLVGLGAVFAQIATGLDLATVLAPGHLVDTLCVVLPELLLVVVPLSLVHSLAGLHQGGELAALAASGRGPWGVVAATLVPLLPALLVLHAAIHEARPAALVRIQVRLMNAPEGLFLGLAARGVGVVREGSAVRALAPLGAAVVAFEADRIAPRVDADGRVMQASSGRIRIVATERTRAARFDTARFSLPEGAVGLSALDVAALSTRFLQTQAVRWQRSRLGWHGEPPARRVRRELVQRRAALPGVLTVLVLLAIGLARARSCSVLVAYGVTAPLAIAISVAVPRILGATWSS